MPVSELFEWKFVSSLLIMKYSLLFDRLTGYYSSVDKEKFVLQSGSLLSHPKRKQKSLKMQHNLSWQEESRCVISWNIKVRL